MKQASIRSWFVVAGCALAACGGKTVPSKSVAVDDDHAHKAAAPVDEDSDDNDEMELVSSRGRMEPAKVEKAMAPHTSAIAACYTEAVAGRKWLGGELTLHWFVTADGTLEHLAVNNATLGAWPVEKCILAIARAIPFGAPKGGAADFTVPLTFSAKGAVETWDEDRALAAVGSQLKKLHDCNKGGAAEGSVAVTAYVGPGGKVASVGFATAEGAPQSDAWFDCAEKIAQKWRLPDPRGRYARLSVVAQVAAP